MRVGLIQNKIVIPTDRPLKEQRDALHQHISTMVKAAAESQVNITCFQEAWSKLFPNPFTKILK